MRDFSIFDKEPILFHSYEGKSSKEWPKVLFDFVMDNQVGASLSGLQALRVGYYKIIDEPQTRGIMGIETYAAHVLFFKAGYTQPILYYCNIGPLMNFEAIYSASENSAGSSWDYFVRSKRFQSKNDFFKKRLKGNTLQVLDEKTVASERFKNVKKVTWTFVSI